MKFHVAMAFNEPDCHIFCWLCVWLSFSCCLIKLWQACKIEYIIASMCWNAMYAFIIVILFRDYDRWFIHWGLGGHQEKPLSGIKLFFPHLICQRWFFLTNGLVGFMFISDQFSCCKVENDIGSMLFFRAFPLSLIFHGFRRFPWFSRLLPCLSTATSIHKSGRGYRESESTESTPCFRHCFDEFSSHAIHQCEMFRNSFLSSLMIYFINFPDERMRFFSLKNKRRLMSRRKVRYH